MKMAVECNTNVAVECANTNVNGRNCLGENHINILIVGDGNFSFSLAYSKTFLDQLEPLEMRKHPDVGPNFLIQLPKEGVRYQIYATSYDNKHVISLNRNALENIEFLKKMDFTTVLHGIDATDLSSFFEIKFMKIIFNFPHVGGKSNIKACRTLLAKFFESAASVLETDGQIYVSLCTGQGGTPIDASRNGYGNTWQIATQAAAAGLVLIDVIPYDIIINKSYTAAGYRGRLEKGFHRDGALTHVFQRKEIQIFPLPETTRIFQDASSLAHYAEKYYMKQLKAMNPYKNKSHPISKTISSLGKALSGYRTLFSNSEELSIGCCQMEASDDQTLRNSLQELNINKKDKAQPVKSTSLVLYTDRKWNAKKELHNMFIRTSEPFYFTKTFINPSVEISPYSYPVYQELVFVCPVSNFKSLQEFADQIQSSIRKAAGDDHTKSRRDIYSATLTNHLDLKLKKYPNFNSKLVPNFLSDIDMEAWLSFKPEITISQEIENGYDNVVEGIEKETKPLEYCQVNYCDYIYNDREKRFFKSSNPNPLTYSECFEETTVLKITVNDLVVAKCGIVKHVIEDTQNDVCCMGSPFFYMAVYFTDQLCMAAKNIDDIRLFWSSDERYLKNLCQERINGSSYAVSPKPTIKYPLCYRHDLCFWLNDYECEKTLLIATRYYTQGAVHSVRLLRILRHEETDSASYCYRIIYSRCDGPLSHMETVELQNKLRLALIEMKYELR